MPTAIRERLRELNKEWDIERYIELHAAQAALAGTILSLTVSRKWLILPAFIGVFLGLHAIKDWCPPVPIL